MRAKDMLSKMVMPLKPSDPGSLALNWMEDMGVTHLPLVEGTHFHGLIRNEDIYNLEDPDDSIGTQKLPLQRTFVYHDVHLYEVLRQAAAESLSLVAVLDHHDHYVGAITTQELTQAMAGFTSITQPGGIIVLEVNEQQYALSEIARIIESNDAKVLSSSVTSAPNSTQLEVTLKLNVMDLSSVIQTLNRYDYIVKASFAEESQYDSLLSERYEALMKFLDT